MALVPVLLLMAIAAVHQAGHMLADRLLGASDSTKPWWLLPGVACIACAGRRTGGWRRLAIGLSGSAASYAFAAAVAFALFAGFGIPSNDGYFAVEDTAAGFDAHGKLEPGDRIVAVDGQAVYALRDGAPADDLAAIVNQSGGQPMAIEIVRDGARHTLDVQTTLDPDLGRHRLGVMLGLDQPRESSVPAAISRALAYPIEQARGVVEGLYEVFFGNTGAELAGPVWIGYLTSNEFGTGAERALNITALLAVYFGLLFFAFDLVVTIIGSAAAGVRGARAARPVSRVGAGVQDE